MAPLWQIDKELRQLFATHKGCSGENNPIENPTFTISTEGWLSANDYKRSRSLRDSLEENGIHIVSFPEGRWGTFWARWYFRLRTEPLDGNGWHWYHRAPSAWRVRLSDEILRRFGK